MVESTNNATKPHTQLPANQTLAEEENKDGSSPLTMYGSKEDFAEAIRGKLAEVHMNALETGLLDKFLTTPETSVQSIADLLKKVESKLELQGNRYQLKRLRRVLALFDKHEFWDTQPVQRSYEMVAADVMNGPVEQKKIEDIPAEPYNLPANYNWCSVDLTDAGQAKEVYDLLEGHYVEDDGGKFRFDYSIPFLRWALNPPGYKPDWIIGVRGGKKNSLFGFITGIPVSMNVNGKKVQMAEINFLCVHKQLRSYRLAPVLIKEITRRVNRCDIWQAIYTAGVTLPTPVGAPVYWHRNLNPQKLVEVEFAYKPANMTQGRYNKNHRLPELPSLPGLRMMEEKDVPHVTELLKNHQEKFYKLFLELNDEEIAHFLLPKEGVISTYVVEDKDGSITDFTSYYSLPSSILGHP